MTCMDDILEKISATGSSNNVALLQALIVILRPEKAVDIEQATSNLRALTYLLHNRPEYAAALRDYLTTLIVSRKLAQLCTDTGILASQGFFAELWQRVNHKWLPPRADADQLKDLLGLVLDQPQDWVWVCGVDTAVWNQLISALGFCWRKSHALHEYLMRELLAAAHVLSYRIAAIGLEPELARNYPPNESPDSLFMRQNADVNLFVDTCRLWQGDRRQRRGAKADVESALVQCDQIICQIQIRAIENGVSISLTRFLLRLTQSIERLRLLLEILDPPSINHARRIGIDLFKLLVRAEADKNNLSQLFRTNTELLALQVTEHAGRSGEHYVTRTRAEWKEMFGSASGAGFIVGFMALLKLLASTLLLAPFGFACMYSLDYSLGFMLVHVLRYTIATKQPAMTAAAIAASIDQGRQKLHELAELIVCIARSQFIAILGNVLVAMPTALAIAVVWRYMTGHHLADMDKAQHLLADIDPFHSLALLYAATAGGCLFLSGLVAGYYDNKATYNEIPARLRQLRWLRHLLGDRRLQRMTDYVGNNLGALAGNFFFGIMLGSAGTVGFIFGLPIDIRHVTFSSANFAFALVGSNGQLTMEQWIFSLSGIVLIAATNLGVSFTLALAVALRSRRISFGQGRALIGLVVKRFWYTPREFFWPPADK